MDLSPLWDFVQKVWPWVSSVVSAAANATVVTAVVLLTSLIGGYIYLQDFLERLRYKEKGYSVQRTLYKHVIENSRTHVLKLRMLRTFRKLDLLDFDVLPTIEQQNDNFKPCEMAILYSVPGRAIKAGPKIMIKFAEEERLKPHKSNAVAVAFTINENWDTLFNPPGIIVDDPVGSDLLVVEVHFPLTHLLLKIGESPKITLSTRKIDDKAWTPIPVPMQHWFRRPRRTFVEAYKDDFLGTGIPTDWLRLSVVKPPKNSQVRLDWEWDLQAMPASVHATPC